MRHLANRGSSHRPRVFIVSRLKEMSRRGLKCDSQGVVNGKLVFEGVMFAVVT